MSLPIIIIGAGGHAKVVIEALRQARKNVVGVVDTDGAKHGKDVLGVKLLGDESMVLGLDPGDIQLANGLGPIEQRRAIFERFGDKEFRFVTVRHPSAVIADSAIVGEGAQIMAGAVVQPDAALGDNVLVNTGASVDHDCDIGHHAHVAPGATLAGGVRVGDGSLIGAGATILEKVRIGAACIVGAGAAVVGDVADGTTVVGVPARPRPS